MAEVMDKTDITCDIQGHIGRIHLNRPEALNALNLDMVRAMTAALVEWQDNPSVRAVLITAEGGRAFCAGGDVVALADSAKGDKSYARTFFAEEYRLNNLTGSYPKPYIALMNGVIMGGGCGISMHGMRRVVGENVKLAMPETGIGLFPDVGGGHFLSRMPGETGTWLALTGTRLNTADVNYLGLVTHCVRESALASLPDVLASADLLRPVTEIDDIFKSHAAIPGPSAIETVREEIDSHFAFDTIEEIVKSLEQGSDWAVEQAAIINKKSPTSLKITLEQIRRAKRLNLAECLKMEYRMGWHVLEGTDFAEGVRALLIDKDNQPNWSPATIPDVSQDAVNGHFEELGDNELNLNVETSHA